MSALAQSWAEEDDDGEQRTNEKSIFLQAIEIATDEERADYLRSACAGNEALRRKLRLYCARTQDRNTFWTLQMLALPHSTNLP